MDVRYVCGQCGTKWVVPNDRPVRDEALTCAACDGPLVLLDEREHAPGWEPPPSVQRP